LSWKYYTKKYKKGVAMTTKECEEWIKKYEKIYNENTDKALSLFLRDKFKETVQFT
jgi:hypothetical protein